MAVAITGATAVAMALAAPVTVAVGMTSRRSKTFFVASELLYWSLSKGFFPNGVQTNISWVNSKDAIGKLVEKKAQRPKNKPPVTLQMGQGGPL